MTGLPSSLRPARADDAAVLAGYHRRCWQTSFRSIVEPEVLAFVENTPMDDLISLWQRRIADGSPQRVVVAVDDTDRPVGHVMVEGNEVVHLFIDPDHHRCGWGRTLLGVGEAMIADAGHDSAELHTMVGNAPAIALYEDTGWSVTDDLLREDLPNGSSYEEHILRKDLRDRSSG